MENFLEENVKIRSTRDMDTSLVLKGLQSKAISSVWTALTATTFCEVTPESEEPLGTGINMFF